MYIGFVHLLPLEQGVTAIGYHILPVIHGYYFIYYYVGQTESHYNFVVGYTLLRGHFPMNEMLTRISSINI